VLAAATQCWEPRLAKAPLFILASHTDPPIGVGLSGVPSHSLSAAALAGVGSGRSVGGVKRSSIGAATSSRRFIGVGGRGGK